MKYFFVNRGPASQNKYMDYLLKMVFFFCHTENIFYDQITFSKVLTERKLFLTINMFHNIPHPP